MSGYNFNDAADLFAPLDTDDVPRRTVSPSAVEAGERNAVINAARERALRRNLARRRRWRTGQSELGFDNEDAA